VQRTRDNANPTRVPELLSSVYANTDEDRLRRMAPAADVKPSTSGTSLTAGSPLCKTSRMENFPTRLCPRGRFQRVMQAVFL